MPENRASDIVPALERQVLRALSAGIGTPAVWIQLADHLSGHRWQDPDHKVVYEALRAIRSCDPKVRRDELPAQITRMGFPDLDLSLYFGSGESSVAEIEGLIGRLKAAALDRS
jgi:hypothetical protein